MTQDPLRLLRSLNWLALDGAALSPSLRDWLMEEDSMTRRFEQHCQKVRVEPVREGFIHADELGDEGALLPADQRFWLREVILYGDEQPWLAGRTLVPESTLNGPEAMLQQLGTRPLGRYLFSSSTLTRDFIEPGNVESLWGRRSRLRLSGKPLLLTELFLPASPVYRYQG
ncbi:MULTISPECIES: chorismate lyase [Pantoea]|uniref:Chorismate pyruvate-lyase n=2 Tax=Pantoea stewartii TaxID=66269 RepID=H3RJ73_PANSE|nr:MULTISPECIES: chorismate lyase [Pantoea]KKW52190.1 chorismate--pyruvate lyase [Pantoea ananatis]ARF48437.1 chorismate lyase [Pantoea stewartii subsp. stewartii DC283]EHT98330.1 chorismate pyruvate lyase [Pantoea stewartii subsp. stewartii DC283]KAB0554795.1 chorismate lyase [Pantoea stewartii subsp. stewartii]KTS26502.1 chorismate--pyruvate lyase [Pantoea stewartii]